MGSASQRTTGEHNADIYKHAFNKDVSALVARSGPGEAYQVEGKR